MRQTQSTAVEGEDGPLVDLPLTPISLLSVRYNELHPYPTPARHFPLSSPYFSFTLIQHSWDLFCFTLAPHIPDFRPTFCLPASNSVLRHRLLGYVHLHPLPIPTCLPTPYISVNGRDRLSDAPGRRSI
jgi:hypothetical protein